MPIDKIFFIEMMTNGIPVIQNINIVKLLRKIEEDAKEYKLEYEVLVLDEELAIVDSQKNVLASLKLTENIKDDWRLLFAVEDYEAAMTIGSVMMLAISACAQMDYFDLSKIPRLKDIAIAPTGEAESETFDSDFI